MHVVDNLLGSSSHLKLRLFLIYTKHQKAFSIATTFSTSFCLGKKRDFDKGQIVIARRLGCKINKSVKKAKPARHKFDLIFCLFDGITMETRFFFLRCLTLQNVYSTFLVDAKCSLNSKTLPNMLEKMWRHIMLLRPEPEGL